MKEYFFEERGLYYETNDIHPDRLTLVLIHGLSPSLAVWKPYVPLFEHDYNIVMFDMRGHGKSRKPTHYDDYTIERIVDDIDVLLSALGVREYIPVSSSYSCFMLLFLLGVRPGAKAAICIAPLYETQKIFLTKVTRALVGFATWLARLFTYSDKPADHTDYKRMGRVWDWSIKLMSHEIANTTLHVYLYYLHHLYSRDFDEWWNRIDVPFFLLHGKNDTISPVSRVIKLAKRLRRAKLVVLPRGNHVSLLNDQKEMGEALVSFVKEAAEG